MSQLKHKPLTETWIKATWDEYLEIVNAPAYEKAKGYYDHGRMRIEMSPVSSAHSRDHFIIITAISIYATLKNIDFNGQDNCTYRKAGCQEVQPDVSFYFGEKAESVPWQRGVVDLNLYPPPDLVIEVALSSLADDKGEKRLLYESLGVKEYWILDVENIAILAFAIADEGSHRIRESQVLPGLEISILEEALRRSRQTNHGLASAWLLQTFSEK